jgi:Nif11 domain
MSIENLSRFRSELTNNQDLRGRLLTVSDADFARAAVEIGRSRGLAFSVEEFESQLTPVELSTEQLKEVVGGVRSSEFPGRPSAFADDGGNLIGCFVSSTGILLADGTARSVANIETGRDRLRIAEGSSVRAEQELSIAGPEILPVVEILTESGNCLTVTQHHPMVLAPTKRIVAAKRLRAGHALFVAVNDGRFLPSPIVNIRRRKYTGLVYNYQVGRSETPDKHFIIANGVLAGDLWLQRIIEARESQRDYLRLQIPEWWCDRRGRLVDALEALVLTI